MAALSALQAKVGYNLGYTLSTTTPATTAMITSFLNDGVEELIAEFFNRKCWKLLTQLHEEAEYTLTGATSYDVYTIIGDSTDYYGFISYGDGRTASRVGVYPLSEVSIEEEHKIQTTNTSGDYFPNASNPYICFYEDDTATGHGNLPKVKIEPYTSTETLYFRYLSKATAMSADASTPDLSTVCDSALVWYATKMGEYRQANQQMQAMADQNYQRELNKLIGKYEEVVWDAPKPIHYI